MDSAPVKIDLNPELVIRRLTEKLAEAMHHQVVLEAALEQIQAENAGLRDQLQTEVTAIRKELDEARAAPARDEPARARSAPAARAVAGFPPLEKDGNDPVRVTDQARADIGRASG
jgi:hypothetical protein